MRGWNLILLPLAAGLAGLAACVGTQPEPATPPATQPTEATQPHTPSLDASELHALFEKGKAAVEKGDYEAGVQTLEAYIKSFSKTNPPKKEQTDDFCTAVYYLHHAYTELRHAGRAVKEISLLSGIHVDYAPLEPKEIARLSSQYSQGIAAVEKGNYGEGVRILESYVANANQAGPSFALDDQQSEEYRKAIYNLKHCYEHFGRIKEAMEIVKKLDLVHAPSGSEYKLQQIQAKLDAAEILKKSGDAGWRDLCNEVLEPLNELLVEQYLITACAHIERARALCLLERYQAGLDILNDKEIWDFILAFDEPFRNEGMIHSAPSAKAYLWKGNLYVGMAEKAEKENDEDRKKFYIDAAKCFLAVLLKYEGEKCPYYQTALVNCNNVRDNLGIKLPPPNIEYEFIDLSVPDRYFSNNEYDKALPLYLDAIFKDGLKTHQGAELLYKAAACYLNTGKLLEAMSLAGLMADLFPNDQTYTPIILLQVGETLWAKREESKQNEDDALLVYSWYVKACPKHQYAEPISTRVANVWYNRGIALAEEANKLPNGPEKEEKNRQAKEAFSKAIPMYRRLLKANEFESGPRVYSYLAAAYSAADQFELAAKTHLEYIDKEMARDAGNRYLDGIADAKYLAAQSFFQAGLALNRQAEELRGKAEVVHLEEKAREFHLEAIKHSLELVGPWREKGGCLAEHQGPKTDRAIERAYELLGWAYDGAGEKEKAKQAFADFIKRYPESKAVEKIKAHTN